MAGHRSHRYRSPEHMRTMKGSRDWQLATGAVSLVRAFFAGSRSSNRVICGYWGLPSLLARELRQFDSARWQETAAFARIRETATLATGKTLAHQPP